MIKEELVKSSTFVLPLASIIETGNHVAQAPRDRFRLAIRLSEIIADAANATSPWAAFTDQADLWGAERLRSLVKEWPDLAVGGMSIGDATIKDVADYYARAQYDVEIVTGDAGLKAYTPARPISVPRRRMASPGPGS